MMQQQRQLGIFLMGGTIDSRNNATLDGIVTPLSTSLVQRYLEEHTLYFLMEFRQICLKDSRHVTDQDRENLLRQIEEVNFKHNLVTHGTYTMRKTARYLFEHGAANNKVIVLTGSMETLLGGIDEQGRLVPSDAPFNLGYAVSETFHADPGVYQAMNGALFKQPSEEWWHDDNGVHCSHTSRI